MARMLLTPATPGVYREDVFLPPAVEFRTGVPVFLGFAARTPPAARLGPDGVGRDGLGAWDGDNPEVRQLAVSRTVTLWPQFEDLFGASLEGSFLAHAVRGFFENGGALCYVVPLDEELAAEEALDAGLQAIARLDGVDLVCAPDVHRTPSETVRLQRRVLDHCRTTGDRFAILDSLRGSGVADVQGVHRPSLSGTDGALYYPWVHVLDGPRESGGLVPACGHVAGVYARSDRRVGVHKAPANEVLEGVLDLEVVLTDSEQGQLNPVGINCLRAFPARGIRVWGARTLADPARPEESPWIYVNVRRLFLTLGRWIERHLAGLQFETNEPALWARIRRELTAYLTELLRRGALRGARAEEAFYVKCDADLNPPEVRDAGMVITEIGLAAAVPGELIVVRIVHGASGVTLSAPQETTDRG